MVDPSQVLSHKLGPSLSHSLDLSKPIDLTTSGLGTGPAHIVLAAGIFDPDTFLSQVRRDFQVLHQSRGRWRLLPKAKPTPETFVCELWHAPDPVGARLICGSEAPLIEQQGEFLMAAARSRVDRSNFHAELPGAAARAVLAKSADEQARKEDPSAATGDRGARAGRALAHQLVLAWGSDLSGFSWDLTLRRDSVEISQELGLARSDSLFATALSGRVAAPKPVPDAFWQLPNDSDVALYSEGAEPEPMRKHAAWLSRELRKGLEVDDEYEFPATQLDQLEQTLQSLVLRGGAFEVAYGQDLDRAAQLLNEAAERASDRGPRSGSADPALIKAQAGLGGWALLGIEDDSRGYLLALREALGLATDSSKFPRKKGAKPGTPSASTHGLRQLPLPASAGLPADALHVVFRSQPNPKYLALKAKPAPPAPSSYHVIAVPDSAQHVWFAIAPDEARALSHLRAVLRPEPDKTLGSSNELRQLAKEPLAGLGFASLAGLSSLGFSADSKAKVLDSRHTLKQLGALPKRGNTRMPIWITRAQS
ncbi:MAG TPA: hypothetical protein VGC79_31960, partial [Polyangiaceae bacterium]